MTKQELIAELELALAPGESLTITGKLPARLSYKELVEIYTTYPSDYVGPALEKVIDAYLCREFIILETLYPKDSRFNLDDLSKLLRPLP